MKRMLLLVGVIVLITSCTSRSRKVAQRDTPSRAAQPRGAAPAEAVVVTGGATNETPSGVIVARGRDSRTWKREKIEKLKDGRTVRRTNTVVELASGMHYRDPADGQLKEAREEVEITADGAKADKLDYKVHFKGNINSPNVFTITTPDQKNLRATVRGLAYTDPVNGHVVMFAPVRDSTGVLMPPNTVLYPDAFTGTRADLRAVVTRGRFESDVILREKLPPPGNWNLDPAATLLEVWTEFDSPEPKRTSRPRGHLVDETLDFGAARIGPGTAFALDVPPGSGNRIPVAKTWLKTPEGKTYLVESVRYSSLAKAMAQLPDRQAAAGPNGPLPPGVAFSSRVAALSAITPSPVATPSRPVQTAWDRPLFERSKGLVVDYTVSFGATNLTNFIFQADTNYLVTGVLNLFGDATFENAVIKFATTNQSVIQVFENVTFKTDFYRPVIFTSQMDNSVGEDVSAVGAPTNYSHALSIGQRDVESHHLRISYANVGLHTFATKVRHALS